ncbi:MAG: hypothetical protein ACFFA3_19325 [Promethearchaeota archaeon]
MKKPVILSLLLFSFLLFSLINYSRAISHEYVGVNVGETYSWEISVNQATFNTFNEDYSDKLDSIKTQFPDFETLFSYGFNEKFDLAATIISLEGEYTNNTGWGDFNYMIANIEISIEIPGIGFLPVPAGPIPIWIMSGDTGNYTINLVNLALYNAITYSPGDFYYVGLFAPYNLNWSKVADDFQILLDLSENMTIAQQENGFKFSCPEGAIKAGSKEFEIILNYDNHGVLKFAELRYDRSALLTFRLQSSEETIFGYQIEITLGIISFNTVLLYFSKIKRKKANHHP